MKIYLVKGKQLKKYIRNSPSNTVLNNLKMYLINARGYLYSFNNKKIQYSPLIKLYDNLIQDISKRNDSSVEMIIPKCIYQTWKTKELTGNYEIASKSWRVINKNYKYELSDDFDSREFIKNNFTTDVLRAYDKLIPGALKADLWRYCKLYIEGGIYADMDLVCLKPLEKYFFGDFDMVTVLDLTESGGGIFQGFLAVSKRNIILKNLIQECIDSINSENYYEETLVVDNYGNIKCKGALAITGPLLFKKVLNKMSRNLDLKTGTNIIRDIKIRLFKYNKNDTISFNNDTLFKHRYTNYTNPEDKIYYAKMWDNKTVFRNSIGNQLTKYKKLNLNHFIEFQTIHYNYNNIENIYSIFTFDSKLYLMVKNNNDAKLYFFFR